VGRMTAMGFAESVEEGQLSLEAALGYHLQHNHYPPVPTSMIPVCVQAIELAAEDNYDALVTLPEGVTWRGDEEAPVWAIVEGHHLEDFI
jgi:hypothetical protein